MGFVMHQLKHMVRWLSAYRNDVCKLCQICVFKSTGGTPLGADHTASRRLGNSELTDSAKYPILLDASHHLTTLVVWRCHERVMHGGVKETLTELRSNFWIVRGRYFIRSLLFRCTVCKKFEGKPYMVMPSPLLPSYRVKEAPAFSYICLDYVGPLFCEV